MAVLGPTASFFPEEILRYIGTVPAPLINPVVQACGALSGFAILNWMARGLLIGGIYRAKAIQTPCGCMSPADGGGPGFPQQTQPGHRAFGTVQDS